ncbi:MULTISPECIES: helix-turn-helix domain-containing protein [unclassified Agrobacterium]|uniref:helix-turn-helix domain-containing protein n=1 Tax=unclassified Agrobacterium TaxID=2632611 RepID=UPI0024476C47|nr:MULTISPECIES: helix-turn-helix domain-containing protein [unclassified Agrobacterium]MDH0613349.1 helix-turn-helix domain-containing protein [Agrobacterium sp. GD03872]MDH0697266.1 helix-turn-helix domain-containing protein [Agrobacterium sp. GD03871]MDH1062199.1 helix-turn-helix domain-containing protein [Agrobacterium sp. GD03992]MDH2211373.1 helix-turn-helix domain-containing protein [Agrobacterium sp. GD03643]MDH2220632.1 helix-turn-helix domain-containing protein [Agrobacterium sp. GD0
MNTFKVGDRVRHREEPSLGEGVVVSLKNREGWVEIKFTHRVKPWTTAFGFEYKYEFLTSDFKVGDRVSSPYGVGTVKALPTPSFNLFAVELDRPYWGHSCDGKTKSQHGAWTSAEDMTLLEQPVVEAVKAATPKAKTITFKKGSQCDRLVKYMLSGNSVTPIKARSLFGAERLAARILEIKKAGHKVKTVIKTDLNGKVYAEYSLRNVGRVAA